MAMPMRPSRAIPSLHPSRVFPAVEFRCAKSRSTASSSRFKQPSVCASGQAVAVPSKRPVARSWTPGIQALPEPPKKADLREVIPYLGRLALTDSALYWRLGLAAAFMVLSKAAGLATPYFLKQAVEALGPMTAPAVKASVGACLLAGLCRIISGVAKECQNPLFSPVAQSAGRKVASNTFAHVLDLDIQFHLDRRSGVLSRILERGTRSVQMLFRIVGFTFLPTVVELAFVAGLLGRIFSPVVGLVVVGTFLGYVSWTLFMTGRITEVRKVANEYDNLTTGKAIDALQNFETVTLFNNQQLEVAQYDEYLQGYQSASIATERVAATLNAGQSVVLSLGVTVALVISLVVTTPGKVTPGDLVMIQGLLTQLWYPLQFLGWFYRELKQSLVDMEEFLKIWQTKTTLPDGHLELPNPSTNGVPEAVALNGNGSGSNGVINGNGAGTNVAKVPLRGSGCAVEFKNIKFGYKEERQVLKGVSLKVPPGQSVALVGGSGSGKSTILKVLARLYDVSEGEVLVDGINVRDLKHESLRNAIGVIPQDTILFNASIRDNILYGCPDATEEEMLSAAKMAQLHDAIMRMPNGYDTIVGERGLRLSGGEKQRVAIARTFVRNPRLLICDEATSALDTATEREIMSSLNLLAEGRTTFFVAHRLSTVVDCDLIVVLAEGKIIEMGSHEELLGLGQTYYDMWKSQAAGKDLYQQCIAIL